MEGTIVRVIEAKGFFFINADGKDIFCHKNSYNNNNPEVGDVVEFETEKTVKGLEAKRAKLVQKKLDDDTSTSHVGNVGTLMEEYLAKLSTGYFNSSGYLKNEFIIEYPQKLAKSFTQDKDINKTSQVRKFYDQCKLIEGKFRLTNNFDRTISELLQLLPLANKSKTKKHISESFYLFFEKNIYEAVKSESNFKLGFIPHYQSLIGYFE